MSEITVNEQTGELSYPVWVKNGGMMVNRDYLGHDHPQQTYNYLKSAGIVPEDYGIQHPLAEEYADWSREKLMGEVVYLRQQLDGLAKAGFL